MPKKIRELKSILRKAGFSCRPGKGSHTKWQHPKGKKVVALSGKDGTDAHRYQEKEVKEALEEIKKNA